jgi:hypothetical protein
MLIAVGGCALDRPPTHSAPRAPTATESAFARPAPVRVGQDARVIALDTLTARMEAALRAVHARLANLKTALQGFGANESDLQQVIGALRPLAASARDDCDAILRTARDLKVEFRFARAGYTAVSELYRERATLQRAPELRDVTLKMAAEFERLSDEVPRRTKVTERFIEQLVELQDFLAATDRCLSDTGAALSILSAGPEPITVSAESRVFRHQLEQFLAVLDEYQGAFRARPATPPASASPEPSPTPPGPAAPPRESKGESKPAASAPRIPPPPAAPTPPTTRLTPPTPPPVAAPPPLPPAVPRPQITESRTPAPAVPRVTALRPPPPPVPPLQQWNTHAAVPPVRVFCTVCQRFHDVPTGVVVPGFRAGP